MDFIFNNEMIFKNSSKSISFKNSDNFKSNTKINLIIICSKHEKHLIIVMVIVMNKQIINEWPQFSEVLR